jgi:hypothetical protein
MPVVPGPTRQSYTHPVRLGIITAKPPELLEEKTGGFALAPQTMLLRQQKIRQHPSGRRTGEENQ